MKSTTLVFICEHIESESHLLCMRWAQINGKSSWVIQCLAQCVASRKGGDIQFYRMEYIFKIKEISPEPIVVRKSNKFVSRLPRLTMDKEGRLVLLTDNLKRFINNSKTLLFALFFLGVLDASSQEYENNSIDGGKHAEWKTFTKAGEPGNEPDIEGSASGLL